MTGQQSLESARAIARVESKLDDMQQQIDRRFTDGEAREIERFEVIREDIAEMRESGKWGLRTAIALVISLLIAAVTVLLNSGGIG